MTAITAELATQPELAARVARLVKDTRERWKVLGAASTVDILREGKELKFRLTKDGVLVYARSGRKVNPRRLDRADLSDIWDQLGGYLAHISQ